MTDASGHEMSLEGMVVFITGAGSGIGMGLAERFSADGATVVGADVGEGAAMAASVCAMAVPCDVTDRPQLEHLVTEADRSFGRVDVLIANAGIARQGTVDDAAWSEIEDVVRVNLLEVLASI